VKLHFSEDWLRRRLAAEGDYDGDITAISPELYEEFSKMSWSFSAIGKPAAVAKKIADELEKYPCSEPEQSIRHKVGEALQVALAAFPGNAAVQIDASGSQSTQSGANEPNTAINNLSVKIQPIYGFVE
jgi:hypothetical protein